MTEPSTRPPSAERAATTSTKPKRARRRELPGGLPPWRRLRATRDFTRVERQGIRAQGGVVSVTVRPGPGRLGLVVSKKVDNKSHERNLIKRRLREILRAHKPLWAQRAAGAVDVVVLALPAAKGVAYAALQQDALATLEKALLKLAKEKAAKDPKATPPR